MHGVGLVSGSRSIPRTELHLTKGKPYLVEAACAGTGPVAFFRVKKTSETNHSSGLQCDGPVYSYPFIGGDLLTFAFQAVDVDPTSGVLAWQIIPQN